MERANQAFRRSSVKLKSLTSGHCELKMILSDINEIRSSFKSFYLAQVTAYEDMAKWSLSEKTIALREVLHTLEDLCYLWSEVQLDFLAGLKKFRQQFKLILESELVLDKSKAHLATCEQRENKIKKELKKATAKGSIDEAKQLTERQAETQALVKVAQTEVKSKTLENETVKLMLLKEGLLNLSTSYLELFDKASLIFQAHKEVVKSLPDVHEGGIEDIKYSGNELHHNILMKTRESIHQYKKPTEIESAPPPPYTRSPVFQTPTSLVGYNSDSSHSHSLYSPHLQPVSESIEYSTDVRPPNYPPQYDLPPRESLENLEGAVGGLSFNDTNSRRYANI